MVSHAVKIFNIDDIVPSSDRQSRPGDVEWVKALQGVDPSADTDRFQPLDVYQLSSRVSISAFGCKGSPFSAFDPILMCFGPTWVDCRGLSLTTSGEVRSAFRIRLKDGRIAVLIFMFLIWNYRFFLGGELVAQVGMGE